MLFRPVSLFSGLLKNSEVTDLAFRRGFGKGWLLKWFGQDTLIWLQQPLDLTIDGLIKRVEKRKWKNLVDSQKYDTKAREHLGNELAAAKFVMENGGQVKFFGANKWYQKKKDGSVILPTMTQVKIIIEAIDASNTNTMYESFSNFENLENIRFLNLSNCKYIDNWCLDYLSIFRSSLSVLNLSNCPRVTDGGLTCLHRFKNLKRLILNDMSGIKDPQMTLMMLEEALPNCFIDGIEYDHHTDAQHNHKNSDKYTKSKIFLDNWEQKVFSHENEKLAQALKLNVGNKS